MRPVRLLWLFVAASLVCAYAAWAQDPTPALPATDLALPTLADPVAQLTRLLIILVVPLVLSGLKRWLPPAYIPYLSSGAGVALQVAAGLVTGNAAPLMDVVSTGLATIGARENGKQTTKIIDGTAKTESPATIEAKGGPTVEEQAATQAKQP